MGYPQLSKRLRLIYIINMGRLVIFQNSNKL